ncbi:MAG: tRNA threonylcarbamoyladenosine biosynthesis protein TsaB [Chloroflexota bacterium]|nr:tRNA threonylcarbamoyladenosine biosynthesis protein TsaB [Chloroflexota bacterium]
MTHDGRRQAILAIDTATTRVVIATGTPGGVADGLSTWTAGYRHGETLLPSIGRFLGEQNIRRSRLTGIVVGTGPGAFTGLRVGIATAKGLAHGLGIPLVGVSTAEALIEAFEEAEGHDAPTVLMLPAGPNDRLVVRAGARPVPLPAGEEPDLAPGERLVAVDLDGRAPEAAVARGETARAGLGQALLRAGAAKLAPAGAATAAGSPISELETLVPDYVTLPRGVRASSGTVEWSRDPR